MARALVERAAVIRRWRVFAILPRPLRERVALQAHIPLPAFLVIVGLQFLPEGYSGQASVNREELNSAREQTFNMLARRWAEKRFNPALSSMATITPLTALPCARKLFLVGAARVVEPFTEREFITLRSGIGGAGNRKGMSESAILIQPPSTRKRTRPCITDDCG
jgi:hypothetical protein